MVSVERVVNASYRDTEELVPFQENPLIAALPEPKTSKVILRSLSYLPSYNAAERNLSVPGRLLACEQIMHFYQPNRNTLQAALQLDNCLRWGYVNRNPLIPDTVQRFNQLFDNANSEIGPVTKLPATYGFSVIGISGIGKTTMLNSILLKYHQVIRHTKYKDANLSLNQVVWLKIDCPPDGSLKGFCRNFMMELDNALGTNYHERYQSNLFSVDQLFNAVRLLAQTYSLGVLVIDELQNLCNTRERVSDVTLNFFVSLVNTIGVPVICCGTGKAKKLFQTSFQQARRGSGKGEIIMSRMSYDSDWIRFFDSMWTLQYIHDVIPITDSMRKTFFEESLGIPYIAVHLYDLAQEEAIVNGKESFSESDVRRIAAERMLLTKQICEKLKKGLEVDLEEDLDVTPYTYYPLESEIDISGDSVKPQDKPDEKKASVSDAVTEALANAIGQDHSIARKFVQKASAAHDAPVSFPTLFQEAYSEWLNSKIEQKTPCINPLVGMKSYEDLRANGLTGAQLDDETIHTVVHHD